MKKLLLSLLLACWCSVASAVTIVFNASTGSDTAASGSQGAIVANGTNASYSGSVVTLDGSPDLSSFDADEDVLWLDTSTGRQFFNLSSVDNTAKTVTCVDAPAGTASGLTWGIGGKRATFDNADSRTVFASTGAKAGWIIETETDQTIGSQITVTFSGATIRGSSGSRKVINQTANVRHFAHASGAVAVGRYENLKLTNSNGSKGNAAGIVIGTSNGTVIVRNCIFGDSSNYLSVGIARNLGTITVQTIDCVFHHCSTAGLSSNGSGFVQATGCLFKDNAKDVSFTSGNPSLVLSNCLLIDSTVRSVEVEGDSIGTVSIINCTINGSAGTGITFNGTGVISGIISNCNITDNNGYGIDTSAASTTACIIEDYNNFGTAGGTANSSGPRTSNLTAGANSVTVDPQYTSVGTDDFSVGTNVKALGFPSAIGLGLSGTTSYVDIGAAQREEPTGGSGDPPFSVGIGN